MERHKGYALLPDAQGRPFPSVHAFLVTPTPFGAGYDPAVVEAIMADTRDMLLGDAVIETQKQKNLATDAVKDANPQGKHLHHHDTNENVIMMKAAEQGTSRTYALRRLSKSPDPTHQDLYQQCLAGALTPNAAMVQAGFRTKPPSHKRTPLDTLRLAWGTVSPDERLHFLVEMMGQAAD